MPVYKLQLLDKKEVAKDTHIFIFSKPDQFTFVPGQYAGFTLPDLLKTHPTLSTKRFSILSTPKDKQIVIATRMQTSVYKTALMNLDMGSEVKMAGPSGNFVLHDEITIPAVFLAGGIGVTPFYSMIQHVVEEKISRSIYLFYANRHPDQAAFLNELYTLQEKWPLFKFIPTMTTSLPDWQGETGYLSDVMIKKYLPDLSETIFYVCGSPNMVTATQEILLNDLAIPTEKIKLEDFPGYL